MSTKGWSVHFSVAPAIAPVIGGWILGWSQWPAIFWFLVLFSAVLWFATWRVLPETHPPEARLPPVPSRLLRDYVGIFLNPRFQRLAAASAFNFGALFLYIASAPAFVLDLLKLSEQQFAWFFVPTIGGMAAGAWVSGRSAGRVGGARLVALGFAASALAMAYNLGYNLLADVPRVPWAVLPMSLNAFGIALVFPVITLVIIDMFPGHRGSASSLQAFTSLVLNALIAGVLSPMISGSGMMLVLTATAFLAVGWGFWRWEVAAMRRAVGTRG
ncbi:MFS transporter [Aerolutibacter ruishenii]|nr:MFS transporter [Lysobacter ruishenii]